MTSGPGTVPNISAGQAMTPDSMEIDASQLRTLEDLFENAPDRPLPRSLISSLSCRIVSTVAHWLIAGSTRSRRRSSAA